MATAEKLNAGPVAQEPQVAKAEVPKRSEAPKVAAAKDADYGIRWFRIEETTDVPRGHGGSMVSLARGKVISSKGYDIDELLGLRVKMVEVDEPGWHRKVQEKAADPKRR